MRLPRTKYLYAAAALALVGAGAAQAATEKLHAMKVAAPDGSVVHVQYTGDVAPRVEVVPVEAVMPADAVVDPFAQMARISAMMDAQMAAMMQRAALVEQQTRAQRMQLQQAVARGEGKPVAPGVTFVGDVPAGMHVTYTSSTTDANGCTRTVSYASDGSGAQPRMTQAASDGCDAAVQGNAVVPAKVEQPVEPAPAPGRKV